MYQGKNVKPCQNKKSLKHGQGEKVKWFAQAEKMAFSCCLQGTVKLV